MNLAREKPPCCICGKTSARDGYCPRHAHIHVMQLVLDTLTRMREPAFANQVWKAITAKQPMSWKAVASAIRRLHHGGFLVRTPTGTGKAALWRPV